MHTQHRKLTGNRGWALRQWALLALPFCCAFSVEVLHGPTAALAQTPPKPAVSPAAGTQPGAAGTAPAGSAAASASTAVKEPSSGASASAGAHTSATDSKATEFDDDALKEEPVGTEPTSLPALLYQARTATVLAARLRTRIAELLGRSMLTPARATALTDGVESWNQVLVTADEQLRKLTKSESSLTLDKAEADKKAKAAKEAADDASADAETKTKAFQAAKNTGTPSATQEAEALQAETHARELRAELEKAEKAQKDAKQKIVDQENQKARLLSDISRAQKGLGSIDDELKELENASGWKLVGTILRARCATAICFDNGAKKDWLGIEPLVELPVGKSFAMSTSNLADYVNNHEIKVDLAAGVRVWLFRDVVSASLYISKPLTDAPARLAGSSFVYPASSVRRPYPGIAIGLLFDSIWVGFDRDELRNGDAQDGSALNPDFPPNTLVSASWTLTVALQPVTAFRTAIGTAVRSSEEKSK